MNMFSSLKTSTVGISVFAVVTSAVIAITQVATKDAIVANEREAQARALYEILPRELMDNDLLNSAFDVVAPELGYGEQTIQGYRAIKDQEVVAVVLPMIAPDGYSGAIQIIAGFYADGRVAGVRVLGHKETPGLGDKIELAKSDWIKTFDGMEYVADYDPRWAVKKDGGDIDQFTGATITPRAVINSVARAAQYFKQNKEWLLTPVLSASSDTQ